MYPRWLSFSVGAYYFVFVLEIFLCLVEFCQMLVPLCVFDWGFIVRYFLNMTLGMCLTKCLQLNP